MPGPVTVLASGVEPGGRSAADWAGCRGARERLLGRLEMVRLDFSELAVGTRRELVEVEARHVAERQRQGRPHFALARDAQPEALELLKPAQWRIPPKLAVQLQASH